MKRPLELFVVILAASFLSAQETTPAQHKLAHARTMSASSSASCAESSNHAENKICVNALIKKLVAVGDKAMDGLKPPVQRPFLTDSSPDVLLVVKAEKSYAPTVELTVYDAEDNSVLWVESRILVDLDNDVAKLFAHFSQARIAARQAEAQEQQKQEEEQRERARQAELEKQLHECGTEFDALKQNIIAYVGVQKVDLPQAILTQITDHNNKCTNKISPEQVMQQEKADEDARIAQAAAERERAVLDQRAAVLAKEKTDMLTLWQNKTASAPFVPPVDSWMSIKPLPQGALWYIVLPGTQSTDGTSGCRFALEKSNPVLDCLGATGRNEYLSLQSNNRWYLLKVGRKVGGDYAGTVKDGGTAVCLRKAGCYRILAEVREVPTELPSKLQVPAPGNLTLTYGSDELSFSYPQNWQTEEKKIRTMC